MRDWVKVFNVGSTHFNRLGCYVVTHSDGKTLRIKYDNGKIAEGDIHTFKKIEGRFLNEKANIPEVNYITYDEACEYLEKSELSLDTVDKLQVLITVITQKEIARQKDLFYRQLQSKGISIDGRELMIPTIDHNVNQRKTGCYNCKYPIDNFTHLECSSCKWIICPNCGSCGCGWRGGANFYKFS
jgi:hypothetical protein